MIGGGGTAGGADEPNVFLFYPNLIGYGRIVLAILACWWMAAESPCAAAVAYGLSALLDAFDGWAARTYDQGSRFGAMLDQLTDRCALAALLIKLAVLYPSYAFWFQMSVVVDIASHWLHLHATDLTGQNTHKSSSNPLLHRYYTDRKFLGFMCFGNEAFYGLLYLAAYYPGLSIFGIGLTHLVALLFLPVAVVKSGISLVHLGTASQTVVAHDQRLIRERKQKKN